MCIILLQFLRVFGKNRTEFELMPLWAYIRCKKMAVPKTKISKRNRNMRRSHDALSVTNWVEDKDTGEPKRRHHRNRFVHRLPAKYRSP